MDTHLHYAAPSSQYVTAVAAPAATLDHTGGRPAPPGAIDEIPRAGQVRFEESILALLPVLQRVAFRLTKGAHDAEDLVQETVTRALTFRHQFRAGSNLRAWLITIMRSIAVSTYRRNYRAPQMQRLDESQQEPALYGPGGRRGSPSAEQMMLHTWLDHDLVAALASLPEPFRQVIELCDIEGRTYQETAQVLGCPPGTVMSRLHRGRARLRKVLTGSDIVGRTRVPAQPPRRGASGVAAERAA
jgi:RNA polymerase sigma-70 factor (ECF subfamily)